MEMNQITAFERALLAQFEKLASACEISLKASEGTSAKLRSLSETISVRLDQIEQQQAGIEESQERLLEALNRQSARMSSLIEQVNRLLNASRK